MSYNMNPHYRRANQDKQALARKSPFKLYCKEQLEKYNVGMISTDEYYNNIANAKLLIG